MSLKQLFLPFQYLGEEKEEAKKELADYLAHFDGRIEGEWGGCFPTGFMGMLLDKTFPFHV